MRKSCCFIGHREIEQSENLAKRTYEIIEKLILEENVGVFFFGSKSRFNSLCYEQTTNLKAKYPHIERVYIRAEYPEIKEDYEKYILERYEQTYYSKKAFGKSAYIKRNYEMIDKSDICIIYFREFYSLKGRKSGTRLAFDYALKKEKRIIIP